MLTGEFYTDDLVRRAKETSRQEMKNPIRECDEEDEDGEEEAYNTNVGDLDLDHNTERTESKADTADTTSKIVPAHPPLVVQASNLLARAETLHPGSLQQMAILKEIETVMAQCASAGSSQASMTMERAAALPVDSPQRRELHKLAMKQMRVSIAEATSQSSTNDPVNVVAAKTGTNGGIGARTLTRKDSMANAKAEFAKYGGGGKDKESKPTRPRHKPSAAQRAAQSKSNGGGAMAPSKSIAQERLQTQLADELASIGVLVPDGEQRHPGTATLSTLALQTKAEARASTPTPPGVFARNNRRSQVCLCFFLCNSVVTDL